MWSVFPWRLYYDVGMGQYYVGVQFVPDRLAAAAGLRRTDLSAVIRDSSKSASQVSPSPAAMSTLSAERPTPLLNSRLTGGRLTPTAGAIVRHAPETLIFHGAKRALRRNSVAVA
jgi:hypothetical protein